VLVPSTPLHDRLRPPSDSSNRQTSASTRGGAGVAILAEEGREARRWHGRGDGVARGRWSGVMHGLGGQRRPYDTDRTTYDPPPSSPSSLKSAQSPLTSHRPPPAPAQSNQQHRSYLPVHSKRSADQLPFTCTLLDPFSDARKQGEGCCCCTQGRSR
jgi:hypothetical protein